MKYALLLVALAACGDDIQPIRYTNPTSGKLRLVEKSHTGTAIALDFVVGDQPLTGFATGFDLPLDTARVSLVDFTPGSALDAGPEPIAARAVIGREQPLAGMLVVAQSQKATAHPSDASLAPGTVLLSLVLAVNQGADPGVVFDGTAKSFVLPSGGLVDRGGTAVVQPSEVAIGKRVLAQ